MQRNKLKKICCWQKVKPQVNPESKPRVKLALGRVWSVLYVQQRLTSTWGRTLYIQVTPHKDSQRSLSAHTCYLQQTHTYFRGPTLYIHVHVISNKYKHVKRPLSVHTCYLQQTNTYIKAILCTYMLHLTNTHIVLRSQSPQVTNKLLFSGSSSPCCSIHAGNICQTTSSQWELYRNRLNKDTPDDSITALL